MGDPHQEPGDKLRADEQQQQHEQGSFEQGHAETQPVEAVHSSNQRRHENQNKHGQQVFKYQPSDRCLSVRRVQEAVVHKAAKKHNGACHGNGQAEHDSRARRPPPELAQSVTEDRGERRLSQRPRDSDTSDFPEVVQ
jgi:hypothetical protein